MNGITKYVGMDVSKDTIAVAVADGDSRVGARYLGAIPNRPESVRKLVRRLGVPEQLQVCYEAGPTGYELWRLLASMDIQCMVVAPSLIPKQPGNRVKTDRRDACRLAELHRTGDLKPAWVPSEEDEALRDLVRAREDAKQDLLRAKHRLGKFFLRRGIRQPVGVRAWSTKYRVWVKSLTFNSSAVQTTFDEYRLTIEEIEARVERLEGEIHVQAEISRYAPIIKALQSFRGIKEIAATTMVAEVGSFLRFDKASQLMAYSGTVPSEHSSGSAVRRGGITKTGNSHLRRIAIQSAWSYRYRPSVSATIKKRQEGVPPAVCAIAWKAQIRLHQKYKHLTLKRGKSGQVAITAVARELLGFVWDAACEIERQRLGVSEVA